MYSSDNSAKRFTVRSARTTHTHERIVEEEDKNQPTEPHGWQSSYQCSDNVGHSRITQI